MDEHLLIYSELEEGTTGNDVIVLQEKLKLLGYYDESVTGSFGDYTKMSVEKFQKNQGLEVTGKVNQKTWTRILELTQEMQPVYKMQTKPTLRLGSTGKYVIQLQEILTNLLYYDGTIDGNFDVTLQKAVKGFQSNNRLTADGIVGRDTWSALDTLYSPLAICEDDKTNNSIYTVVSGDTLFMRNNE